jgi:hypothetical protein
MAYVGNVPAVAYTNTVKDTFSGDGSTVAFTLSLPTTTNNVRVVVENVIQDPTVAYGVSGTTLTFTSAPPSGTNNVYVVHLGPAVQTVQPPTQLSGNFTLTGDLTQTGDYALTGAASISGQLDTASILPTADATSVLGGASNRYTNLFLSGGVYLGGTGSANLLDDYEEGTFTPTFVSSGGGESVTYDDQSGFYTKIGDRVLFNLSLGTDAVSGGSGYIQVHGLPFTVRGSVGGFGIVISLAYNFASTITGGSTGAVAGSTTRMDLYKNDNSANVWAWSTLATGSSSNRLWISGHYLTT